MIQQKQFAGGLLALGISIALQASVSAATDTSSTSWLMSEAEMRAHKATMARLEGQARDEYRNAQYGQLKKRAQERGFQLPENPPWAQQTDNPTVAAQGGDAAAAAAARHAEMREKLQARREAMQKASEANLERLQEAANAQQQEVEAQLQADRQQLNQDTPKSEPAALPAAPAPAAAESMAAEAPAAPVEASTTAPVAAAPAAPAPATVSPPEPVPVVVTEAPTQAPVRMTPPQPPTPPTPPSPPAKAATTAEPAPRFAPVEQTAAPIPPPARPLAPVQIGDTAESAPEAVVGDPPSDAMTAYRESMRARFDEYMQERQMQLEENARRQREQHAAAMEKNRALRANRGPYAPYPYPAAPPSYGPRYPAAYPGYRTPYWQQ